MRELESVILRSVMENTITTPDNGGHLKDIIVEN